MVCGNEQYAGLFRLLTSIELYENAEFYADHPALLDASDQIGKEVAYLFPDIVCSKGWDDDTFTKDGRKPVVEAEAIRICKDGFDCGLIAVMGLSSLLQHPIFSLYPDVTYKHRSIFNRKIHPRVFVSDEKQCFFILWSRIKLQSSNQMFIPNHFVPVVLK